MKRLFFFLGVLLGLPKSIKFNLRYFGIKGLLLPVILSRRTRLTLVKGNIILKKPLKFGLIKIGFSGVSISTFHEYNVWNVQGEIIFEGTADLGTGAKIFVGPNGRLIIGNNLLITANSEICCSYSITIGNDALLSWDVLLMDSDSHPVRNLKGQIINPDKPIIIGNNVWIGCRSLILKGTLIKNNSIVGACSLTNKNFDSENIVIAGNPAEVVRTSIIWEREHF